MFRTQKGTQSSLAGRGAEGHGCASFCHTGDYPAGRMDRAPPPLMEEAGMVTGLGAQGQMVGSGHF